jgi:hypothetical protein
VIGFAELLLIVAAALAAGFWLTRPPPPNERPLFGPESHAEPRKSHRCNSYSNQPPKGPRP